MKFNKHTIYIGLFVILYLIVAFSSFWHAVAFFGLANNSWMSIILAFAFEVGQAAVLFSLLTSKKDRGRVMPWVLMTMFTLVQVIGNVYSSYKYIITNSVENLKYFKEPIFIWTELPDAQANVIIVYLVGALLPLCSLMLTSMITNYLSDIDGDNKITFNDPINSEGDSLLNQNSILHMENQGLKESLENKDSEIEELKKKLKEYENNDNIIEDINDDEVEHEETGEEVGEEVGEEIKDEEIKPEEPEEELEKKLDESEEVDKKIEDEEVEPKEVKSEETDKEPEEELEKKLVEHEEDSKKPSHFINL